MQRGAATARTADIYENAVENSPPNSECHSRRCGADCRKDSARSGRDEVAMRRVQRGDAEAFGHLFQRYSRPVLSLAMRILQNRAEAQDVLQDVFLYIHRKSGIFDSSRGTVASWVLQVAHSKSLNRLKRFRTGPLAWPVPISTINQVADAKIGPERVTEMVLAEKVVQRALGELAECQRETLRLYFFEELTLREISARRNESMGNTRHHYYRGIRKLRSAILLNKHTEKVRRSPLPAADGRSSEISPEDKNSMERNQTR
jgi:RNA polymerase sigma-70 factor, ECF subfamily